MPIWRPSEIIYTLIRTCSKSFWLFSLVTYSYDLGPNIKIKARKMLSMDFSKTLVILSKPHQQDLPSISVAEVTSWGQMHKYKASGHLETLKCLIHEWIKLILAQFLPGKAKLEQCPRENAPPGGLHYGHVPVADFTFKRTNWSGKIIASKSQVPFYSNTAFKA